MKRMIALLLAILITGMLCACGGEAEQPLSQAELVSPSPAELTVSAAKTEDGYVIPSAWTEESIDDGSFGYVTEEAGLELGDSFTVSGGYLVSMERDWTTGAVTFRRYELNEDGIATTLFDSLTLDVAPQTDDGGSYIGQYVYGADCLWFIRSSYRVVDQDTGETESSFRLEQTDLQGNILLDIPLDGSSDAGFDLNGEFVTGIALAPDGGLLLSTIDRLIFCDSRGHVTGEVPGDSSMHEICQDRDGRVYIYDDTQVYTVDWEHHALGEALFPVNWDEHPVLPGGGPYDFLLSSGSVLKGVSLESGTVTEILQWADCDLVESAGTVVCVDENTFLVSVWDLLSGDSNNQLLRLRRVPAEQIPEKTVIRMAATLSQEQAEYMSKADAVDQILMMAINRFNRGSSEYRVELETFSGATELGMMLAAGDIPDLIDWNNYGRFINDPVSMEALAGRGYLLDLEPLIDEDPELSAGDLLPGLFTAAKSRTGGLHAVPISIYPQFLQGRTEYVSEYAGGGAWTVSDLLEAGRAMPEDMSLIPYMTQQEALSYFLECAMPAFVDTDGGTCDFENQTFYDLLTLCRDYCPAETGENYEPGDSLLIGDSIMGRLGQFASETLRTDGQSGWSLMPFPNTGGSPFVYAVYDELSVCAYGAHPEGAWQFLRTLLTYDYQYNSRGMMPVRIDAMNAREDLYLEVNGSCTAEESQAVRTMILNSTALRSRDMTVVNMILEEASPFFAGDKNAEQVAAILQSRVSIYLAEMG